MKIVVSAILFVLLLVCVFTEASNVQSAKVNASSRGETVQAAGTDWWPMFQHDLSNTGTSTSKAPTTNNTLWSYTMGGPVFCSPAVVGGLVYVAMDNGVNCLNAATGALVWNYTTDGYVRSSPAVVNGVVYLGSRDGRIDAFGAHARYKVPEDFQTIQFAISNASSGDTILVANGTFNEHLTINKSIALIGAGSNSTILNGTTAGAAIQITADNVTIEGFGIQHFYTGIIINQSENIYIAEDQITQIWTKGATYVINSKNITLGGNTITNCDSSGISMLKTNTTKVFHNTISHNTGVGIYLENCTNFTATDNQIESNGGDAICTAYAYNFYITMNTFALNDYRGIWAARSNGTIFHNNFVRNRENARSIFSNLTWDDDYPSGGNYWSNYSGGDLLSGANQNQIGSDGIGDVPFIIPQQDALEQDRYPLMGNFTELTPTGAKNYTVDFASNAIIHDLHANQSEKSLSFTINNPNKTEGLCRVVIPKSLMQCDDPSQWEVGVGGIQIGRMITENGNYTYIYFTLAQGTHTVEITATHIVPEISILALLLFLILTFSVAIYTGDKPKKTRTQRRLFSQPSYHISCGA